MKKLLLLFLIISGILHAQEPYRQLLITEASNRDWDDNYIEITNVGSQSVNLKDFKLGVLSEYHTPILDVNVDPWIPTHAGYWFIDRKSVV